MNYKELFTERLHLRTLNNSDAEAILFLRSDSIVNAYVQRQPTNTINDAISFIEKIKKSITDNAICYWCLAKKSNSQTIGTICLWNFSEDLKTAEIGYDLHPDAHGKGLMSEALEAVLHFGFTDLKLDTIEAFTHHANTSSLLLLQKQNFEHAKTRHDEENVNNIVFVLEKSKYKL